MIYFQIDLINYIRQYNINRLYRVFMQRFFLTIQIYVLYFN